MKPTVLLLLAVLALPAVATAGELSAEKKAAIHKLLQMSGAGQMKERFGDLFVKQMQAQFAAQNPDLPPRAQAIVVQETRAVVGEQMQGPDGLFELVYPVYAEHFTLAELQALVAFYQTPAGAKALRVMPQVTAQALAAGQRWAQAVNHAVQARVAKRLAAEGLR